MLPAAYDLSLQAQKANRLMDIRENLLWLCSLPKIISDNLEIYSLLTVHHLEPLWHVPYPSLLLNRALYILPYRPRILTLLRRLRASSPHHIPTKQNNIIAYDLIYPPQTFQLLLLINSFIISWSSLSAATCNAMPPLLSQADMTAPLSKSHVIIWVEPALSPSVPV
jgi:hypothetical protein